MKEGGGHDGSLGCTCLDCPAARELDMRERGEEGRDLPGSGPVSGEHAAGNPAGWSGRLFPALGEHTEPGDLPLWSPGQQTRLRGVRWNWEPGRRRGSSLRE